MTIENFCCNHCGRYFDEDEAVKNRSTDVEEFWGQKVARESCELGCPECDSLNISELSICDECGEAETMDGLDHCAACIVSENYSHIIDFEPEIVAEARGIVGQS